MLNFLLSFLFIFSIQSVSSFVGNDEETYSVIQVGNAKLKREKVAIFLPKKFNSIRSDVKINSSVLSNLKTVKSIIKSDFSFYRYSFDLSFIDENKSFTFSNLPEIFDELSMNYDYFIFIDPSLDFTTREINKVVNGKTLKEVIIDETKIKLYSLNLSKKSVLLNKDIIIKNRVVRKLIHKVNDFAYQSITNKKSIFNSEIIFVSDVTSQNGNIYKELYIMDFDGKNIKRLTFYNATVVAPSFSKDNNKILYTLISSRSRRSVKNVDLYEYDRKKKVHRLISSKKGLNSGAIYSQNSNEIILTMSYTGVPNIYKFNMMTKKTTPITNHFASDVDPSLSKDGDLLAFLSNRSGKAMIYTLMPDKVESNVKRISYVGKYNASPRFSPTRRELVFSSWLDNKFDIFRINVLNGELFRLTKDFGSNEDANYSSDGEFVVFSSLRVISDKKAVKNLYIMTRDGQIISPITQNSGMCQTADWSN